MTEEKLDTELRMILKRYGDDWAESVLNADIADIKRAFKKAGCLFYEEVSSRKVGKAKGEGA